MKIQIDIWQSESQSYSDNETQHSLAANPFIRCSPAPDTQQPAMNGAPKGPFDDAQQPEPYIAANPMRPLTCWIFCTYNYL